MSPINPEKRAAELLNVSVRTLQKWRVEGRGPKFKKFGKRVGYTEEDLAEYVQANTHQSTSEPPSQAA